MIAIQPKLQFAETMAAPATIMPAQAKRKDQMPDLIVEIDITSPSLNKFPLFSALAIPEIWRYDGERISIFVLQSNQYIEQPGSIALPYVTGAALTDLLEAGLQMRRTEWLPGVRAWVRSQRNR